jgi:hypothetical protein
VTVFTSYDTLAISSGRTPHTWTHLTLQASEYRTTPGTGRLEGMQYLSLMIGSSDMPLGASSAESGRTADAPGALPRPPTSLWASSTNWPMLGAS